MHAIDEKLIVKVWAGGIAGRSHIPDDLPLVNSFSGLDAPGEF